MKDFPLCFPKSELKLSIINEKLNVWDVIRRKFVVLTPEEYVRQQLLHFLLQNNYPAGYIRTENGIKEAERKQRTDLTVYDKKNEIFLLAECKAPHVPISLSAQTQLAVYQYYKKSRFLLLTNGIELHYFRLTEKGVEKTESLPDWREANRETAGF
jgi:hypothetical protein